MRRFVKTLYGKAAIVLCLILLFSLTVIQVHRQTVQRYGRAQQLASIRQQNAVCAASANTAFTLLEENLFYLPGNNPSFQELLHEGDGTLEHWAMVSNIRQQLATLQSTCPYVESFFFYYPSRGLFLNEQVNPEMSLRIRELIAGDDPSLTEYWVPVRLSEGCFLLRVYALRGYYLGGWARCGDVLSYFAVDAAGETFLYSAAGDALSEGAPTEALDADALAGEGRLADGLLLTSLAERPGVYLARRATEAELNAAGTISQASFAMVCLLHVVLLMLVMAAIGLWVLRPVRALSGGIQRVRGGETDFRMPPAPRFSTEFQEIQTEFNAMLDETQQMRIQIYEQQLRQDEVKLRYLSQQIQPHFILNSLNMLYAYIGREDALARKLIRLLAQYYRYIINIESQYVEIGQEMDHLENYLAFQKVRYGERLAYAIECDPAVRGVPVPPLLLESFVGNVLKYGQDEEDRVAIGVVADAPEPGTVRVRVSDHGGGFPEEILDALKNYQKTGRRDELLGVGICNSLDRLRLIYGEDAAIYFYNGEDHGAVVEILLHPAGAGEETEAGA